MAAHGSKSYQATFEGVVEHRLHIINILDLTLEALQMRGAVPIATIKPHEGEDPMRPSKMEIISALYNITKSIVNVDKKKEAASIKTPKSKENSGSFL